jgi:hypothetical protein
VGADSETLEIKIVMYFEASLLQRSIIIVWLVG